MSYTVNGYVGLSVLSPAAYPLKNLLISNKGNPNCLMNETEDTEIE